MSQMRARRMANEIFMISDGKDISTTTLLKKISRVAGLSNLLIPLPNYLIFAFGYLLEELNQLVNY